MQILAEEQVDLGRALIRAGNHLEAVQCMARAIKFQPDYFEAYRWLGILQRHLGDSQAAKAWYLLSLHCSSVSPDVYMDLGGVCMELGQGPEAVGYLLRALDTASLDWAEYQAVGIALSRLGEPVRATEALTRSNAMHPTAETWNQLGFCRFLQSDPVAAEELYRTALRCDPECASAHANLGLTLLLRGEYEEGFREYDWRLKIQGRNYYHFEGFEAPLWRGEPMAGKTILLHAEQGYGDTLQFLRYVPMVAARQARVLLVAQPALRKLVMNHPGVSECISITERLPEVDLQCPLMSLPHVFGTTFTTVPEVAQIVPPPPDNDPQQGLIRPFQVGLVWAGNPRHVTDRNRTLHLKTFEELGVLGDQVAFVSLQHGEAARQLSERHTAFAIRDACSIVKDFTDTAAIVAGLDLVITVDTAMAHLAGSMGKPVWVLLGPVPEWRWTLEGDTTPWYPTARLFRLGKQDGWEDVMKRVAVELREFCSSRLP